jgi:RIO kinase 1
LRTAERDRKNGSSDLHQRWSESRGAVTCLRLSLACPQTNSSRSGATTMHLEFSSPTADADTRTTDPIDPQFVFDFVAYDELGDDQRWSTWLDVEPLSRGPEPRPDWVVTTQGAIDTDLGILKTGKEADVYLLERADPHDPEQSVVMAAKRYRSPEHRSFRHLHRGPQHEAVARRAGDQAQEQFRPRGRRR